jgi:putative DNA primase/helicase
MWHPTLLIDEVDTFVGEDEELRGIINNSHKYDGSVTRTVGEDHEPRKFCVYGAVALSGIGGLAATLTDRSVTIDLKRKRPGEKVTKLRFKHIKQLHELRRRIVRWVADHEESIAKREPKMPGIIDDDREADNWEVLLAIADEAGGEWPERARRAAIAAHAAASDDDASLLELLLADIRDIFTTEETKEIRSSILINTLICLRGRPWAEIGKNDKPITPTKLARMLKEVGIAPGMIGPKDKRVSGYVLAQFRDAFERYLPAEGDSTLTPSHYAANTGTSDDSKPHTEDTGCEAGKCEKPNNDGKVCGCEVAKGGNGKDTESTPPKKGRRKIKIPGFAGVEDREPWH